VVVGGVVVVVGLPLPAPPGPPLVVVGGTVFVVVVGGFVVVVGVVVGVVVVVVGPPLPAPPGPPLVVVGGSVVVVVVGGFVVVVGVVVQLGRVMVLVSRLTWPVRASTRPFTVVPVCTDAEVCARMVPTKVVFVPRVAELPTSKKTLHGEAPLISLTVLLDAVIRVDPAWKMNTALGSPCAFKVTVPVRPSPLAVVYTPATKVFPPRSVPAEAVDGRPAASLKAVVRSAWACFAVASAAWMVPLVTTPGGKPVTAVPGLTPKSPEITEAPVLVTVLPASTANGAAVPSPTVEVPANAAGVPATSPTSTMAMVAPTASSAAHQRRSERAWTS